MLPSEPGARYRPVGSPAVYLCGNSLGLAPKRTRAYISEELTKWETHGVEGHFRTVRAVAARGRCCRRVHKDWDKTGGGATNCLPHCTNAAPPLAEHPVGVH